MQACMIIGHRGTNNGVVENTIPAFEKAIEQGAQMIEFDVWKCATGEIVVFHDQTLERLAGDPRFIQHLSLREIEAISLSNGAKIPTLREVLDVIDCKIKLNIEIKDDEAFEGVGNLLREYVEKKGWSYTDFLVSSFDHFGIRFFISEFAEIPTGAITYAALIDYGQYLDCLKVDYAIVGVQRLNAAFYDSLKESGKRIIVYTVNDRDTLARLLQLDIYAVITDFPDRINRDYASILASR